MWVESQINVCVFPTNKLNETNKIDLFSLKNIANIDYGDHLEYGQTLMIWSLGAILIINKKERYKTVKMDCIFKCKVNSYRPESQWEHEFIILNKLLIVCKSSICLSCKKKQ